MKRMTKKPFDPTLPGYLATLTREQLDAESDRYDEPFLAMNESRPATSEELAEHPKRRAGRPPSGLPRSARVLVTMRPELLKRTDAYAKRHGMTRAGLIQTALEQVMKRKKSA